MGYTTSDFGCHLADVGGTVTLSQQHGTVCSCHGWGMDSQVKWMEPEPSIIAKIRIQEPEPQSEAMNQSKVPEEEAGSVIEAQ